MRWVRDENDVANSKGNVVEYVLLDMGGRIEFYLPTLHLKLIEVVSFKDLMSFITAKIRSLTWVVSNRNF